MGYRCVALGLALGSALAVWGAPTVAEACGGTFCDAGPQPMPVDQTGENVLFVMSEHMVEAHVQIQYSGDPSQFAWVVPVMAEPTIDVGSDPLFQNLLAATVPTFTVTGRGENCPGGGSRGGFGCSATDDDALSGSTADFPGQGVEDDEPTIEQRGLAGSFEYAVLSGGTVEGVTGWLDEHGFAQDEEAEPILGEYLDDGFRFVAFKLRPGRGVSEIHPVVIRYAGSEPCVPLRLTRIAAQDDMGIRVFFLGEHRVAPTNYRHVVLNPLKFDWEDEGSNYNEVVSLAVDEEGIEGRGFVTEYAGSPEVVQTIGIRDDEWSAAPFREAFDPRSLTSRLENTNLLNCELGGPIGDGCAFTHPLVSGLLATYFPLPESIDPEQFYGCSSCEFLLTEVEWDYQGFADALEEQIIGPANDALDLLRSHDYLTRMYTTISPVEMTRDPIFHEAEGLPDVSNQWSAVKVTDCEGPDWLELPDGTVVSYDDDDNPPQFAEMPYSLRAHEVPLTGAPMEIADRTEEVEDTLDAWNRRWGAGAGCDCRAHRRRLDGAWTLMALFGLGLYVRRQRRRR